MLIFLKMNTKLKVAKHFDKEKLDDSSIERENAINEDKTSDTDMLDLQGNSEAKEEHKEFYIVHQNIMMPFKSKVETHCFSNSLMPLTWSNQML